MVLIAQWLLGVLLQGAGLVVDILVRGTGIGWISIPVAITDQQTVVAAATQLGCVWADLAWRLTPGALVITAGEVVANII